jgi:imidazolonepropionase-like amidohydrolase
MILQGSLIDGKGNYKEKSIIEIHNGKITKVEHITERKNNTDFYDVGNMVIMPGLIDSHVHLWGVRTMDYFRRLHVPEEINILRASHDLEKLIDAGYTSVRDAGSKGGIYLRNVVNEGTLRGPRIKTPRLAINQTGGHLDRHFIPLDEVKALKWQSVCRIADGPDDCRRAVREQLREGADYIKICVTGGLTGEKEALEETQFSEEEIKVIVEETNRKGKKVSAHAFGLKGVKKAVQLGVHLIEHGGFLDEEICEQMVKKDIILTPTLTISYKYANEGKDHGALPWAVERAKIVLDAHVKSFQLAHSFGVKIAAGTDFSGPPMVPFGKNAIELELMVKAGFSPMEAIMAATRIGSEVLGIDSELGTIETGKLADLIVVDGNPLEDIRILQDETKIRLVMKEGIILKSTLNC